MVFGKTVWYEYIRIFSSIQKPNILNSNEFRVHRLMIHQSRHSSHNSESNYMNVFDRTAKLYQKERAATSAEVHLYDYIKENVGYNLVDRLECIKRKFPLTVDLGCGRGYVSKHLSSDVVTNLIMCDLSPTMLEQAEQPKNGIQVEKQIVDEEKLPFKNDSIDLIISCLTLHWVNDLPGTFSQIKSCLKNDGLFMAAVFGCDTLFELRCSLQLAQLEREGGISSHISPFTEVRDIGSLLTRAGYSMLTMDVGEIVVNYPTMFELMWDLKGMGENNAARNRSVHLRKETMLAASAIYANLYGKDGVVPATFQIIYFLGWKPDSSQPQPLKRGSAKHSLKDLHNIDEIIESSSQKEDPNHKK